MYVYACMYVCMIEEIEHTTGTPPEHLRNTSGTQDTSGKERNTGKAGKPVYIGIIADNEKKVQKKVKKNLEIRKKVVTLYP